MFRAIIAACFFAGCALHAQSTITGVLHQQRGDQRLPVPDCPVFARSPSNGPLVAEYSDSLGRFRLEVPPDPRVNLGTMCPAYSLISIDGRNAPFATFDCSQPGLCADVQLTVQPLAVLEGRVVDPNGMPVEQMRLELRQAGAGPRTARWPASSDDRGRFRFSHLPPGAYELGAISHSPLREGVNWESDPLSIRLAPGDVQSVQVQLRLTEGVEFSGRIEGLPPDAKEVILAFRSEINGVRSIATRNVQVDEDGRFRLPGMQRGRYEVELALPTPEIAFGLAPRAHIGSVDLFSPGGEAVLTRREPIQVRGTLEVEWPERKDYPGPPEGAPITFRFVRDDGFQEYTHGRSPDYRFEVQGLRPGRYKLLFSIPGAKAERLRAEGAWEPFSELALAEGDILDLTLRVRFELGRLTVLVRPAPGQPETGFFVVGIRRNNITRLFPTDQNGRLEIDYFPSGDYQICAWPDISPEKAVDPNTWLEAASSIREFRHEEAVDMEITLTAAP